MKLCSICDKKIEGTWCKNCKRFVKTYDIPDGIYLNESHDPKNDAGCTYHTITREHTGTQKKSKAGKIAALIIGAYVLFGVAGVIVPAVIGTVIENVFSDETEDKDSDYDYDYETAWNEPSLSQLMLQWLEPVKESIVEEGGYTYEYCYYEPEDIKRLDVACDGGHLDMDRTAFEELLEEEIGGSENWEFEETTYYGCNYKCDCEGYAWTYFETDLSYYVDDALLINIDCDTATGDFHMILFDADAETMETKDYMKFYNRLLQELDPGYTGTAASFAKEVEKSLAETDGYESLALSEKVDVYAMKNEDIVLVYYPVY